MTVEYVLLYSHLCTPISASDLQGRGSSIRKVILYMLTLLHAWMATNFIYSRGVAADEKELFYLAKNIVHINRRFEA